MSFSSLIFIFAFLPLTLLLYHLLPTSQIKNVVLLVASLLFYAWDQPKFLILLILSVLWNYVSALSFDQETDTKKRKRSFIFGVVVNILILGFFKYTNFFLGGLVQLKLSLPIGLSFFTFSAISYLADVYMGKSKAQRNILYVALYISFFGKVNMGPIVQYHDMEDFLAKREVTGEKWNTGIVLFLKGLFKKVLIADRLAVMFAALATDASVLGTWLYAIGYMLQLYFDFSGYSDMAIGLSRLFGFDFAPNFDHPYIALNIQDFWRRWHISLSRWFRDYIYIPLGGNRVSQTMYIRNIMIVWLCTGLWHGANWTFIVWGLYYGVLLLLEKYFLRDLLSHVPTAVQHIYTLLLVLIGWVFFMSPNIGAAFGVIGRMFFIGTKGLVSNTAWFYLKSNLLLLIVACIFSTTFYKYLWRMDVVFLRKQAPLAATIVYVVLFVISITYIISSTYQSFLYFAF